MIDKETSEHFKLQQWKYRVMDFLEDELLKKIKEMSREAIIEWLAWNDTNGIYTDKDSKQEFGNILSKREAGEIMFRMLMRDRQGWNGMMGNKFIGHTD